tara:strand:- start:656 stop:1030 length:375 start_codon:yes stop_codon:yes gene_type:complete
VKKKMPVLTKEFELAEGITIKVRQAGGMTKLKIENRQAKTFRKYQHFGLDTTEWTEEQQTEFAVALEDAGCGMEDQVKEWIPKCVISPQDFDIDDLTSQELRMILGFVRGDDEDGALPLEPSSE